MALAEILLAQAAELLDVAAHCQQPGMARRMKTNARKVIALAHREAKVCTSSISGVDQNVKSSCGC
jgi:hypothetical protein